MDVDLWPFIKQKRIILNVLSFYLKKIPLKTRIKIEEIKFQSLKRNTNKITHQKDTPKSESGLCCVFA